MFSVLDSMTCLAGSPGDYMMFQWRVSGSPGRRVILLGLAGRRVARSPADSITCLAGRRVAASPGCRVDE